MKHVVTNVCLNYIISIHFSTIKCIEKYKTLIWWSICDTWFTRPQKIIPTPPTIKHETAWKKRKQPCQILLSTVTWERVYFNIINFTVIYLTTWSIKAKERSWINYLVIREGADAVDFRTQTKIKINSLIF